MRPELAGLKGGPKQHWLRMHRKEVEKFYFQNGPEATMQEFNLTQDTLKRFWDRKNDDVKLEKLSEADRYVLRMAMEHDSAVSQRVRVLEEKWEEAEPVIRLGKAILEATTERLGLKVVNAALPDDLLRLDNLGEKSGK